MYTSCKRKPSRPITTWRGVVMAEISEEKSHFAGHNMVHKIRINGEGLLLPQKPYVLQETKRIKYVSKYLNIGF